MDKINDEKKDDIDNIKEMGIGNIPKLKNNIQYISIIGEIEGHSIASDGKKATKYYSFVNCCSGRS